MVKRNAINRNLVWNFIQGRSCNFLLRLHHRMLHSRLLHLWHSACHLLIFVGTRTRGGTLGFAAAVRKTATGAGPQLIG
jgi:hypothetical protein